MNERLSVHVALDAHSDCGESPIWDAHSHQLIWVDQFPGLLHRYDPVTGQYASRTVGQAIGAIAPRAADGLVLALADGFWLLAPDGVSMSRFAPVEEDVSDNMMNDGKCDRFGRFWAGTLAIDEHGPVGSLYRLDPDGTVTRVLEGITVSNGLAWSLDNRTFYYIDSRTHRVDAFRYDSSAGTISARRPFIEIPPDDGIPDGMSIDAEGHLWVALWGGSAIRRYSPDGELEREVRFPATQITSCAFGGDDLADLYVTSATHGLTPTELTQQPHAGGLFVVRPGVTGVLTDAFSG